MCTGKICIYITNTDSITMKLKHFLCIFPTLYSYGFNLNVSNLRPAPPLDIPSDERVAPSIKQRMSMPRFGLILPGITKISR